MSDSVIEFEGVSRAYRLGGVDVRALDGVTIRFGRGEFWAVMGPSGSGKSTMLNLLGCLDRPTGGRCLLGGRDIATMDDDQLSRARLAQIGFVFQSFNLIPQLTVRENIELPLFYLGREPHDAAARARDLAHLVGLGDRLNHRPTELSGGQRQRVAIARALANEPALILADEPTGNLDSATGEQIMQMLAAVHRAGRTIVMVTHETDIAAHATHRLHLRDGRIERVERPATAAGELRTC